MSEVKRLAIGILLVFVGLFMVLSSSAGFVPYVGVAIGLGGVAMVIIALRSGQVK